MIVLDYLKRTHHDTILVPPFHTGHLGLLPETLVHVGLIAFPGEGEHCELIVTPYEQSLNKAYVNCTMKDQPGVVQRLLAAVSILGINIEAQESSAINRLNHHAVNLLIDWSSSELRTRHSTRQQRQRYATWQANFPVTEERYVRLFESIIAHCGHLIVWDELAHARRPHLFIRPVAGHQTRPSGHSKVQRRERGAEQNPDRGQSFHVQIPIPEEVLGSLHNRLGTTLGTDLYYVLLSETDERVLRVFFPRPKLIPKILHLGFYHKDLPGALAAITDLLASEKFNILTSLLRKTSKNESVWEAMLEYRGSSSLPENTPEAKCRWVAHHLTSRAEQDRRDLRQFEFFVGRPLYPIVNNAVRVPLKGSTLADNEAIENVDVDKVLHERVHEARNAVAGDKEAEQLMLAVHGAIENAKPSIFLSFPHNAREHAELVIQRLSDAYQMVKYEPHGAEVISDKVLEMVSKADYYIGIWHHDEKLPTSNGKYGISPWMPFEYGIAAALAKPRMVVHSDKLDESIWKRIDPGIATPEYSDLRFQEETLDRVSDYCRTNFSEQRRWED